MGCGIYVGTSTDREVQDILLKNQQQKEEQDEGFRDIKVSKR